MFYEKIAQIDIMNEIYNISRHYNIDKKHLLHSYLNHIVRLKLIPITQNTIEIIKNSSHSKCRNGRRYHLFNRKFKTY